MRIVMPYKLFRMRVPEARYEHLPQRVTDAIGAEQDASERVIGWFQLAVVTVFATLYMVSPKTFSPEAEFVPVPWVLTLYLLFTLGRLILAYRMRMGPALLYLSIVIDMGLLFGLIWSFHLQYMQPPSFYLKAPTLLYVFIFIALRALRFEWSYVAVAGAVAAIGWGVLVTYAMYATGGMEMVTSDYVYYLTSNSILLGAEFDKIISILTVTVIMVVAIRRARRLLTRSVAEEAAAHDLSRFFSPEIASRITAAEREVRAGEGQARDAAILNCDIRGFTKFATLVSPDELMATLAEYQRRLVPVIQKHGGAIDKFMGDGIMATFGATVRTDTYAADALRAIDDIMATADQWNAERVEAGKPPIRVGAASATGRIIFGAVGDETRLEYTVIGEAVNLSAKLEKHTKSENVRALCDASTFDKASDQGYRPSNEPPRRPARVVEGVADSVDLVVLAA